MSTQPTSDPSADEVFVVRFAEHLDQQAARPDRAEPAPDESTPGEPAPEPVDQAEPAQVLFAAVVQELRTASAWSGPPADIRDRVLAAARQRPAVASDTVETPAPARWRSGRWRPRWRRPAWAVPIAVLAAAAFTAGVLAVDRALAPDPPRPDTYAATGTSLAPDARATVSVLETPAGVDITVEPTGLPAAAPGSYYAAWLVGPRGSVPIGSFHWRRTGVPIKLWSGVDVAGYPTLVITLQGESDPPGPSTRVVMSAPVAP